MGPERVKQKVAAKEPKIDLSQLFSNSAALSKVVPGYIPRPGQSQMAETVWQALTSESIAVVEAGTGTGKSLAYLVPAIYWAVSTDNRVVIATHTINLQEQLVNKDLPAALQATGQEIPFMLVKGRSNYLCRRRFSVLQDDMGRLHPADRGIFLDIWRALGTYKYGDRAELKVPCPDELWHELNAQSEGCLGQYCPMQQSCFIRKLRQDAAECQIIVVNHHLLLADAAIKDGGQNEQGVLPAYQALIVDEAHHFEEVATGFFGREIGYSEWLRLWREIYRRDGRQINGLLVRLRERASQSSGGPGAAAGTSASASAAVPAAGADHAAGLARIDEAFDWSSRALETGCEWFESLAGIVSSGQRQESGERYWRITGNLDNDPNWSAMLSMLQNVETITSKAVALLTEISRDVLETEKLASEDSDLALPLALANAVERIKAALQIAVEVMSGPLQGKASWLEMTPGRSLTLKVVERPLTVAELISEKVIGQVEAAVFTSATLTAANSMKYWCSRNGLNLIPEERVLTKIVPSPFDYQNQLLFGVPIDLPDSRAGDFLTQAAAFLYQLLETTKGRAFLLFTSYRMLTALHNMMQETLEEMGLTPFRQGECDRSTLLEKFRASGNGVLFAASSFWEGVDVPGEVLSCVVLMKLPFAVPTDPLFEARAEEISGQGGNPFAMLSLPQAVLRFKQGFGRLIRRVDDRGAVIVLDNRLVLKPYGRFFFESLPDCRSVKGNAFEVLRALQAFFGRTAETQSAGASARYAGEN